MSTIKICDIQLKTEYLTEAESREIIGGGYLDSDSEGLAELDDGGSLYGTMVVSDFGLLWETDDY
jgi:hypothetical protein